MREANKLGMGTEKGVQVSGWGYERMEDFRMKAWGKG